MTLQGFRVQRSNVQGVESDFLIQVIYVLCYMVIVLKCMVYHEHMYIYIHTRVFLEPSIYRTYSVIGCFRVSTDCLALNTTRQERDEAEATGGGALLMPEPSSRCEALESCGFED